MFNNLVLGKERGKLKKQLSALLSKKEEFLVSISLTTKYKWEYAKSAYSPCKYTSD